MAIGRFSWLVGYTASLLWLLIPSMALPEDPPVGKQPAPKLVDGDGRALPTGAVARLGTLSFRRTSEIGALAYTPDGKSLMVAWGNRLVTIDVRTGREMYAPILAMIQSLRSGTRAG